MNDKRRPYFQAHKPTDDPPDKASHDMAVVVVGIIVILIMFWLASHIPGHQYT